MEARGIRDQLVIATKVRILTFEGVYPTQLIRIFPNINNEKFTTNFKRGQKSIPIQVNYTGNSLKSLHVSVEASLKKLRTTYIDILYVHWWDYETSIEEVMNGLHNLVAQGKVLYLVRPFGSNPPFELF